MKTPDEIKKGLYHCGADDVGCTGCSYNKKNVMCEGNMEIDALTYIVTLENLLAQVERERDAAVRDLAKAMSLDGVEDCSFCKNIKKPYCDPCKWEWRGVCTENTKEE